jgi:hypothetical protein
LAITTALPDVDVDEARNRSVGFARRKMLHMKLRLGHVLAYQAQIVLAPGELVAELERVLASISRKEGAGCHINSHK